MKTLSFVILLLFLCPCFVLGQVSSIQALSVADGLPTRAINCMVEDKDGYLWVGTDEGLYRFDGSEFIEVLEITADSLTLPDPSVTSLSESEDGELLIGTAKGLAVLSANRQQFTGLYKSASLGLKGHLEVETVEKIAPATYVGANSFALFLFSEGQARLLPLPGKLDTTNGYILPSQVFSLQHGQFLLLNPLIDDIFQLNAKGETLHRFSPVRPYMTTAFERENRLLHLAGLMPPHGSSAPVFFIDTYHLNGQLLSHRAVPAPTAIDAQFVLKLFRDANQNFWLGTSGEPLIFYDGLKEEVRDVSWDSKQKAGGVAILRVKDMVEDGQQNIWLATSLGLVGLQQEPAKFEVLRPNGFAPGRIFSTRAIVPLASENLLISSYSGNYIYDIDKASFSMLFPNDQSPLLFRDFLPLKKDHLLIASENKGLYDLNQSTATAQRVLDYFGNIKSLARKGNQIWIGTNTGIFTFGHNEQAMDWPSEINKPLQNMLAEIAAMHYDSAHQRIYAGTASGLLQLSLIDGSHQFYNLAHGAVLSSYSVITTLYDDGEFLWLGTKGNGLVKFDKGLGEYVIYTESQGLADNVVYSILPDKDNHLWIGTAGGLSAFAKNGSSFTNFYETDGLANNEFNTNSSYTSPDGIYYMGGIDGITVFDPKLVLAEPHHSMLRLTRLSKYNDEQLWESSFGISPEEPVEITPKDLYFTLHFSDVNLFPNGIKYEYRLVGLSDSWQYLGEQSYVRFAGLPAGEYRFEVRPTGRAKSEGASLSLPLLVSKIWYKTIWAWSLFALAGLSILTLLAWIRFRQLRVTHRLRLDYLKIEKAREIHEVKNAFYINLSHEFRTPLTLLIGPLDQEIKAETQPVRKQTLQMMQRNAGRLLELVNQLMDLSRLEAFQARLQVEESDLALQLKMTLAQFESMVPEKRLAIEFVGPGEELIAYYDREKMEKIAGNLISNAIKFSETGGFVRVSCAVKDADYVQVKVENSGQAIPSEKLPLIFDRFYQLDQHSDQGSGIGLALVRELVELHGGSVQASSAEDITTFEVRLPYRKESYQKDQLKIKRIEKDKLNGNKTLARDLSRTATAQVLNGTFTVPNEGAGAPKEKPKNLPLVQIVDDNADIRKFLKLCLADDFRTIESPDGATALAQAREEIPDLVISDLMMPQMDGHELCAQLRADHLTSHIPVILLTARAAPESKIRGYRHGADDYLLKPFKEEELLARAKNLIATRQHLRQKYSGEKMLSLKSHQVHKPEDTYLQKAIAVVEQHLSDEQFTVEDWSKELHLSRRQLHRKLTAITGKSPLLVIRQVRLNAALELLKDRELRISEVAHQTGFSSVSYFSRAFKQEYGVSPKEI